MNTFRAYINGELYYTLPPLRGGDFNNQLQFSEFMSCSSREVSDLYYSWEVFYHTELTTVSIRKGFRVYFVLR